MVKPLELGKEVFPVSRKGSTGFQSPAPSVLERLGGVLIDSESTFKAMLEGGVGVGGALLTVLVFSMVEGFTLGASLSGFLHHFGDFLTWLGFSLLGGFSLTWLNWLLIPSLIVGLTLFNLIFWTLTSWISHIAAKYVFCGEGSYVQLLTLTGYGWTAVMPFLAGLALANLTESLLLLTVLTLTSLAWFFTVWVTAVKVAYGLDIGRAFTASFLTPLTIYVIILFVVFKIPGVM
ncbi:MAG: hypothetical protein DRO46_04910 [Candidatus Hecatellales archaeon]|nr:MAG: hypothetical protein DRO46_04910 [Candidatus Hecatellales archaeon]